MGIEESKWGIPGWVSSSVLLLLGLICRGLQEVGLIPADVALLGYYGLVLGGLLLVIVWVVRGRFDELETRGRQMVAVGAVATVLMTVLAVLQWPTIQNVIASYKKEQNPRFIAAVSDAPNGAKSIMPVAPPLTNRGLDIVYLDPLKLLADNDREWEKNLAEREADQKAQTSKELDEFKRDVNAQFRSLQDEVRQALRQTPAAQSASAPQPPTAKPMSPTNLRLIQ